MSSRKNSTVTGCEGTIRKRNVWGSLIDVHWEEMSCNRCTLAETSGCIEFRIRAGFEKIHEKGI